VAGLVSPVLLGHCPGPLVPGAALCKLAQLDVDILHMPHLVSHGVKHMHGTSPLPFPIPASSTRYLQAVVPQLAERVLY